MKIKDGSYAYRPAKDFTAIKFCLWIEHNGLRKAVISAQEFKDLMVLSAKNLNSNWPQYTFIHHVQCQKMW